MSSSSSLGASKTFETISKSCSNKRISHHITLNYLIGFVIALQSIARLGDCQFKSLSQAIQAPLSSTISDFQYQPQELQRDIIQEKYDSIRKFENFRLDVTDLRIIPELRAVKLNWNYEYEPPIHPTAFQIKYCELTSWNDEIKCRSRESPIQNNTNHSARLQLTSEPVIQSSTTLPPNSFGALQQTKRYFVNKYNHTNYHGEKNQHNVINVVRKGETLLQLDKRQHVNNQRDGQHQRMLAHYEAHIYDLRAQTNYTFQVQVLRFNTHNDTSLNNNSNFANELYRSRAPRPAAAERQLTVWPSSASPSSPPMPSMLPSSIAGNDAAGEELLTASASHKQNQGGDTIATNNNEATMSNEISDMQHNSHLSARLVLAPATTDGRASTSASIGGFHPNNSINYTSRIETKPFAAEATRCLADVSEVVVNTGRYFGGRISVEDSQDPRCQLLGNRSSEQSSYLFRIDHDICRSKLMDGNRIETIVLVHENKDILTHNTARFLILCNFIQKSFTLKTSISLPKVNGFMSSLASSGALNNNNHHQQQSALSVPANITQLPGKLSFLSRNSPTSANSIETSAVGGAAAVHHKLGDLPVRLGSMPGFFRAAKHPPPRISSVQHQQQPLSLASHNSRSDRSLDLLALNSIMPEVHRSDDNLNLDQQKPNKLKASPRVMALKNDAELMINYQQQQPSKLQSSNELNPSNRNQSDDLAVFLRSSVIKPSIGRARSLSTSPQADHDSALQLPRASFAEQADHHQTMAKAGTQTNGMDTIGGAASAPKGVVLAVPLGQNRPYQQYATVAAAGANQQVEPEPVRVQSQVLFVGPSVSDSNGSTSSREARQLLPNGVSLIRSASSIAKSRNSNLQQQLSSQSSDHNLRKLHNLPEKNIFNNRPSQDQSKNLQHANQIAEGDYVAKPMADSASTLASFQPDHDETKFKGLRVGPASGEESIVLSNNHRVSDHFPSLSAPPQATTPLKMTSTSDIENTENGFSIKYSGAPDIDNYSYSGESNHSATRDNSGSPVADSSRSNELKTTTGSPSNKPAILDAASPLMMLDSASPRSSDAEIARSRTPVGGERPTSSRGQVEPIASPANVHPPRTGKVLSETTAENSDQDSENYTNNNTSRDINMGGQQQQQQQKREQQFSLAQNITNQLLHLSLKTLTNVARRTVELLVNGAENNNNSNKLTSVRNANSSYPNAGVSPAHPNHRHGSFDNEDAENGYIDSSPSNQVANEENASKISGGGGGGGDDEDYEDSDGTPGAIAQNSQASGTISQEQSRKTSAGHDQGREHVNLPEAHHDLANRLSASRLAHATFLTDRPPMINNSALSGIASGAAGTTQTTSTSTIGKSHSTSRANSTPTTTNYLATRSAKDNGPLAGGTLEDNIQANGSTISPSLSSASDLSIPNNGLPKTTTTTTTTQSSSKQRTINNGDNQDGAGNNANQISISSTQNTSIKMDLGNPNASTNLISPNGDNNHHNNDNNNNSSLTEQPTTVAEHEIAEPSAATSPISSPAPPDSQSSSPVSAPESKKLSGGSHRSSGSRALKFPAPAGFRESDGFIVQPTTKETTVLDRDGAIVSEAGRSLQTKEPAPVVNGKDKRAEDRPTSSPRFNENQVLEFREPVTKRRSLVYWPFFSLLLIACVASSLVISIWFISLRHHQFNATFFNSHNNNDRSSASNTNSNRTGNLLRLGRKIADIPRLNRTDANGNKQPHLPPAQNKSQLDIVDPPRLNSLGNNGALARSSKLNNANANNNSKLILNNNNNNNNHDYHQNRVNPNKIYATCKLIASKHQPSDSISEGGVAGREQPFSASYASPIQTSLPYYHEEDLNSDHSFENNRSDGCFVVSHKCDTTTKDHHKQKTRKGPRATSRVRPRSHCSSYSDTTLSTSRGSFSQTSLSNGSTTLIVGSASCNHNNENVCRDNNEVLYSDHVLINLGSHRGESYA